MGKDSFLKVVGTLIIMCLLVIGFNLFSGLNSGMNDAYDPNHAERIAQFVIILVPLVIVFIFMGVWKMIKPKKD